MTDGVKQQATFPSSLLLSRMLGISSLSVGIQVVVLLSVTDCQPHSLELQQAIEEGGDALVAQLERHEFLRGDTVQLRPCSQQAWHSLLAQRSLLLGGRSE